MRLSVETRPFGPHPLLGLDVDELRWLAPVRPDDVLHLEGEFVELTPSRSKPQGIVKVKWTAFNQRGEPVYTFTPIGLVPRRPACSPNFAPVRGRIVRRRAVNGFARDSVFSVA